MLRVFTILLVSLRVGSTFGGNQDSHETDLAYSLQGSSLCHVERSNCSNSAVPVYEYEKRILQKVFGNTNFRKYSRPVKHSKKVVMITFDAELIQIVGLNEKSEVLVTRFWLSMEWKDHDLLWNPEDCGNLTRIRVNTKLIWTPDICLYNNAESKFNIPLINPVTLSSNGVITWQGPVIFHSSCHINVGDFPFDVQNCSLKLGSWTYTTNQVDLRMKRRCKKNDNCGKVGMDKYYDSAEWDVKDAYGVKHVRAYRSTADEFYSDITYYLIIRRLPLYYIVNMIIPCFEIALITTLIFFLPAGSQEKITLCISILVLLILFLLLIIDFVPPNDEVLPFLGHFILLTLILVVASIVVTVFSVTIATRQPRMKKMPPTVKSIFLIRLSGLLRIQLPPHSFTPLNYDVTDLVHSNSQSSPRHFESDRRFDEILKWQACFSRRSNKQNCFKNVVTNMNKKLKSELNHGELSDTMVSHCRGVQSLLDICYVIQHHQVRETINDEWRSLSYVIDRIFLIIYFLLNTGIVGMVLASRYKNDV